MTTTRPAHGSNEPERPRYNSCPACIELWVAAWMARLGVHPCPLCEDPLYPSPADLATPMPRSGRGSKRRVASVRSPDRSWFGTLADRTGDEPVASPDGQLATASRAGKRSGGRK
jgi:hypothetical protein